MPDDPSLPRLTEREEDAFNDYVRHFRRNVAPKMKGSAFVLSFLPSRRDGLDIKFCTELGAAIMLDKPIIAVSTLGMPVPKRLRAVADEVIESLADPDTEEGRAELMLRSREAMKRLGLETEQP